MINEIVMKLEKENPGVIFKVNNYNPNTSVPYIEVRGSFPEKLIIPSDMEMVGKDIYYGTFRYHMVPLP